VPELLVPKGTINFINVGDDYYAIVPTETNLKNSEVRNAYLQFVIDPLVLDNVKPILTVSDGVKALLDERRKENPSVSPDVFLAVLRSLVAAVDARQVEFEKTRLATSQARQKIDLIIVGADRIARNGDAANKIGTYGLAILAAHHGIPFYVAAPRSSFDFQMNSGAEIPIEERHASEVREFAGAAAAGEKTSVYNPAFDITPGHLITAIVTEYGILRPPYRESIPALADRPNAGVLI